MIRGLAQHITENDVSHHCFILHTHFHTMFRHNSTTVTSGGGLNLLEKQNQLDFLIPFSVNG